MKRVLVTGGTGCVGRHVLPLLVARGWDVHAVASKQAPAAEPGVTWHSANLVDEAAAEAVVARARATHLLHLAWYIAPGRWAHAPDNVAWVRASLALVDAFRRHGGARVVGAGSCLEYDWTYGYCHEDRTPKAPHTVYGTCKHALQLVLAAMASTSEMSAAWGRIFFLYGPHEHPDRLVSSVIRSLLADTPAMTSHGRQVRDYLYAGDVADAFVRLLESDVAGPINIASGRAVALRDIVERIGAIMGRPDLLRIGAMPAAPTDTPLVVADTRRLTDALAWAPSVDLESGLERTIAWWASQPRLAAAPGA